MKKVSFTLILAITILISSCSSCKKQDNPAPDNPYGLPNATQTGTGVFACRINGQNFISYYNIRNTKATLLAGDTIWVIGTQELSNIVYQSISFKLYPPINTMLYTVNNKTCFSDYDTDSTCNSLQTTFSISNDMSVQVTKYDKNIKTISGTFAGKFPINGCDTLKVTDGRFDFNYY